MEKLQLTNFRRKIGRPLKLVTCNHIDKEGKSELQPIEDNKFKCSCCNVEFKMETVEQQKLHAALTTIHNAINQMKNLLPDDGDRTIQLGALNQNLQGLEELYQRTMTMTLRSKRRSDRKGLDFLN